MTRRLILIRHAKSSWDDPYADDHARVLNDRGRASSSAIGAWLADQGYVPDVVLSSDSERTKETTRLILPALPSAPKLRFSSLLYHAAPDTILDLARREEAGVVAIVGHNPGIGMLANGIVAKPPDHHRFSDYPTCATTIIDFATSEWSQIVPRQGTCVDFIVPRDLIGTAGREAD